MKINNKKFDEIEIDRIYEIRFYSLCMNIFNYRKNPEDIANFIKFIITFMSSCILGPLLDFKNDLFSYKYKPSKQEIVQVLHYQNFSYGNIATKLNISKPTVAKIVNSSNILYPRAPKYILENIRKFMIEYDILFTENFKEVIK